MAGSLQPRIKTWVSTEAVVYSDLNAEFDNVLTAMQPLLIDDYSTDVTQMQVTTDPGEVGTESKATTLAGELARLRFMIYQITGKSKWYESPITSLAGLANAIGTGATNNRLISGKLSSTSSQPVFLNANGAAKTVNLKGATTNFLYDVDGTQYTISTDITLTGLTAAASSNNTCLVNDSLAAGGIATKYRGEDGTDIPVDAMGSSITPLVGTFAAFKLAGAATEYFLAYVASTTSLTKVRRGFFFDSTDAAVARTTYSDNNVITVMKLTWVFATTAGALTATYSNPIYSKDQPSSPSIGDYWYDLANNTWKVYGVGSYSAANATLVGICIQDATNTIAARSFEFFAAYSDKNTLELVYDSATQIKSRDPGAVVSVWGSIIKSDQNIRTWDITLDLDSGVTEAASTTYYFYLTQAGDQIISNVKPFDRRTDLGGYYHPHQSWRCVGSAYNDASQNLGSVSSYYLSLIRSANVLSPSIIATAPVSPFTQINRLDASGGSTIIYLPAAALCPGLELKFLRTDATFANSATITPNGAETIGGYTSYALWTQNEYLVIFSDGTNWQVAHHVCNTDWTASVNLINFYTFTISSGSATIAATYTNNGITYTVNKTVASGVTVIMQGSGNPQASGTLTKSGGTGDATLTFSAYTGSAHTVGATTTVPYYYGTPITNAYRWRREGRHAVLWMQYYQDTAGATAGSGDYLWPMPTGLIIDSTTYPLFTTGTAQAVTSQDPALQVSFTPAWGRGTRSAVQGTITSAAPYTTSTFRVYASDTNTDGNYAFGSSRHSANVIHAINVQIPFPITGWKP